MYVAFLAVDMDIDIQTSTRDLESSGFLCQIIVTGSNFIYLICQNDRVAAKGIAISSNLSHRRVVVFL